METCVGCKEPIRWYDKKDHHRRPWHYRCMASWEQGYETAQTFAEEENHKHGIAAPWELYRDRCNNMYRDYNAENPS
jgi:hypothetical protein